MIKDWLRKFPSYFQPFDWHHSAISAPGMAACLIYGLVSHDTLTAAIAGGSAFSVGFGLRRKRETLSMLGAAVVMTAATIIGSLIGGNLILFAIVLAAASAGCAMLALIDDDSWWVALQATIALLLASHYGADFHGASQRGIIVLVAGIAQMGLVLLLNRLIPQGNPKTAPSVPIPATKRALMLYGLVAALSVGGALLLAHAVRLDKAYWAPMTALIILKPKYHLTRQRGFERLGGNVAGCALATLIAVCLPPLAWFDTVLCIVGSAAAYGLLKARYAAFSFAVSFTAVMLLFTAHQSAVIGAEQRLYATVLGGAMSICVMWLVSKTVARDYLL